MLNKLPVETVETVKSILFLSQTPEFSNGSPLWEIRGLSWHTLPL